MHDIDIVVPLFHVITEKERGEGEEERKETIIATSYLELIELIVYYSLYEYTTKEKIESSIDYKLEDYTISCGFNWNMN